MMAVLRRVASAVVLIPLFLGVVLGGPAWLFDLLVAAAAATASLELARMFRAAGRATYTWSGVIGGTVLLGSFVVPAGVVGPASPVLVFTALIVVLLSLPVASGAAPSTEASATTLLRVAYIHWLLGHALWLRRLGGGAGLVLFAAGVTWLGESAAYFVGSAIGRHKLAPAISPGKTVEGAVAQVVTAVVAAIALGSWLVPSWPLSRRVLAGVLLGVVGQVGDLAESVMKRATGTKDAGALIPGHGGALDRLDSLLFNVPALYYFVTVSEASP